MTTKGELLGIGNSGYNIIEVIVNLPPLRHIRPRTGYVSDGRLESRLHDQINLVTEPVFEIFAQVQKVEEVDVTVESLPDRSDHHGRDQGKKGYAPYGKTEGQLGEFRH